MFGWQRAQLGELAHGLRPGAAAELEQAALDVHLDRARADEQGLADLPAGVAPCNEQHDLPFTTGQAACRAGAAAGRRRPWLAAQLTQCRVARGPPAARAQPARGVVGRVEEL